MIAPDTNFLVYAHRSDNPFHLIARTAIDRLVHGMLPWGVPVVCVHEFFSGGHQLQDFQAAHAARNRFRANGRAAGAVRCPLADAN